MTAVFAPLPLISGLSSAAGIISLLDEESSALQVQALEKLYLVVDRYWAEIADAVPLIESLAEDESFPNRSLAAAVASKCFFHLEEYSDALRLAMGAGKYFDVNSKSQYIETLVATCIDEYIALRNQDDKSTAMVIDPRMDEIVEGMFKRCYQDQTFAQAMGIALESRRLDKIREVFDHAKQVSSSSISKLLTYTFHVCRSILSNRDFRLKVLEEMVLVYNSIKNPDYSATCQCLQILNRHSDVVNILEKLIRSSDDDDTLIAYQVAFDLFENENPKFLTAVRSSLPKPVVPAPVAVSAPVSTSTAEGTPVTTTVEVPVAEPVAPSAPEGAPSDYWNRISKLGSILSGTFTGELILSFLYSKTDSDMLLMKKIKTAVENRNSVLHHAAVVAHSYLNFGTTVDTFLRENLDWMGRATNWAKFTATASLGVIHKSHVKESMTLLQPYLPSGGVSASPYSEGGALYALGLIHVNHQDELGSERQTYLQTALRNAGTDETIQHGACLGLGLTAFAKHDYALYEELKNVMFSDSADAGEAASLSVGLVLFGAGSASAQNGEIVSEMLAYAHDTKHEKIIRGACLAIALMMYGREEEADGLIEQMSRDRDPVIRYGAMFTLAMAYCGTSNNSAIRRLLHVAVSDVSDDVRRAAVLCLGFLLFRTPEQVPKLVSLLSESFNPHVRYGSCLAVGIACAGTAKNEALQLLEPMMEDPVDFVRQGAMMALAMVMMQESDAKSPTIAKIRAKFQSVISDKHQTTMTKMGAILAQGMLDAGGRNVVISMVSRTGFAKMSAVVGLMVWSQHWFWYPYMHFLELAFQSTAVIGLNKDLLMPTSFHAICRAKPSTFAYPKHLEEKKEGKKELVATAVLSTTAKAKARQAKKTGEDDSVVDPKEKEVEATSMEVDEEETKKDDESPVTTKTETMEKPRPEPESFTLENPDRVTRSQEMFVHFDMTQRYVPIIAGRKPAGIIMLKDTRPNEPEEVTKIQAPSANSSTEEEADPPEAFEWTPPTSVSA